VTRVTKNYYYYLLDSYFGKNYIGCMYKYKVLVSKDGVFKILGTFFGEELPKLMANSKPIRTST